MGASHPIENQQLSYEVFEKKHYMECTTRHGAWSVAGAALIVCVATICYDYADKARWRRLLESSAGTTPGGGARHRDAPPPRPSPPPPSLREGCMSHSTPGAPRTPPFYGWWMV